MGSPGRFLKNHTQPCLSRQTGLEAKKSALKTRNRLGCPDFRFHLGSQGPWLRERDWDVVLSLPGSGRNPPHNLCWVEPNKMANWSQHLQHRLGPNLGMSQNVGSPKEWLFSFWLTFQPGRKGYPHKNTYQETGLCQRSNRSRAGAPLMHTSWHKLFAVKNLGERQT